MADRKRRHEESSSAAADADAASSAAFRAALRHARPFIKSELEWHSGNVQEFPTFMTDFYWPGGKWSGGEPSDPLIHVRFPHLAPARRACLETIWRLTAGGCVFFKANTESFGNMYNDHLYLDGYEPMVPTAAIAAAAHRMTVRAGAAHGTT